MIARMERTLAASVWEWGDGSGVVIEAEGSRLASLAVAENDGRALVGDLEFDGAVTVGGINVDADDRDDRARGRLEQQEYVQGERVVADLAGRVGEDDQARSS